MTVNYSWKNCKVKTPFKEEFLGKPKDNGRDENKDTREIWSLWHLQLQPNIKHSPTLSQINIKIFHSVLITVYIMCSFQQKITRHAKRW